MTSSARPTIVLLGASGLIGNALAADLQRRGFRVAAVARRFTQVQKAALNETVELPVVDLDADALRQLLEERGADLVANCVGVLQDGPAGSTEEAHTGFAARLTQAIHGLGRPGLLIHFSIPAGPAGETAFSRTKRNAEEVIAASDVPYAILRPGFVVAPAAYGGSALIRALAATPFALPSEQAGKPFAVIGIEEIAETIAFLADRWAAGNREWHATWDLMHQDVGTFGDVVTDFRAWLGVGGARGLPLLGWLVRAGAGAADWAGRLGWRAPMRSNALSELGRGVTGNPDAWRSATRIAPRPLAAILGSLPATIQEKWFARLYLLKPAIIACLVLFWMASGLIALTVSFDAAAAVLASHGFPTAFARIITVVSSVTDILVGLSIAVRRTCRAGLWAGIAVSLFYMVGAALITPDLWIEPLGALVKTAPAIMLMAVALAVLDDR
jgi:uncharacterized protein YbjT (DUF2867 family)